MNSPLKPSARNAWTNDGQNAPFQTGTDGRVRPADRRESQADSSRGYEVIDGLKMLVGEGVIGVEYWTGFNPRADVMRAALEDVFGP